MQPVPSFPIHTSGQHRPVGIAELSAHASTASATVAAQQEQVDNAVKAAAVDVDVAETGTQPSLTEPTVSATPQSAQQLLDSLADYYSTSPAGQSAADIGQTDSARATRRQNPEDNPLYGLSSQPDSTMAMFADLMAAVLYMLRSSVDLKNQAVKNYFDATTKMAGEQLKEGIAEMWGSVAAGVTGATISGIGAARSTYGVGKEIGAHQDQRRLDAVGANNPFVPTQQQIDTKMIQAKSHQTWGEWGQRGFAQLAGTMLTGGSNLDKAGHTRKATESNANATVANLTGDQQGQEVHSAAAIVAKLMEQLAQYASTQKQTISAIAGNFRPV